MKMNSSFWATLMVTLSLIGASTPAAPIEAAGPALDSKCGQFKSDHFKINYCIDRLPGSSNQDVLYYFHGAEGDEHQWAKAKRFPLIYQALGKQAPIVVSLSYGPYWILAPQNSAQYSGEYENFVQQAMGQFEKIVGLHPARRLGFGISMGGFNLSQIYLKNPGVFSRVALGCPMITTPGPFGSDDDVNTYIARTHSKAKDVHESIDFVRMYFPTLSDWQAAEPVSNTVQRVSSRFPPLYVSGGMQDEYGFFEASLAMVEAVKRKGANAVWIPVEGIHCAFDIPALAQFLLAP